MRDFRIGDNVKLSDFSCQKIFNNCEHDGVGEVLETGCIKGFCEVCGDIVNDIKIQIGNEIGWVMSRHLRLAVEVEKYNKEQCVKMIACLKNIYEQANKSSALREALNDCYEEIEEIITGVK